MRLALGGGGPNDTMDPHVVPDFPSGVYVFALYDQLTTVDENMNLTMRLAEEFTPSSDAREWTLRLKPDIEFHNGKTADADDVIFTFHRIFNPRTHAISAWMGGLVDNISKLDERTVRFSLNRPLGWFDIAVGDGGATSLVPVGFDVQHPVGTGPFTLSSFTPGQVAVFKRFPNYFGGAALLDELKIVTINDDTARFNAILDDQVDVAQSILPAQVAQVRGTSGLNAYISDQGGMTPLTMRVDKAPFDDVRVRQALRLCIDRQRVKESASGYATVAADVYAPFDPDYDQSLHRAQDLDQAKSLLKQAGQSGLTTQLVYSAITPTVGSVAQVLAENAASIGVTIKLNQVDPATLFGPNFLSWPFAVDLWGGYRYLTTSALADGPFASNNETHFGNPSYYRLWNDASATLDPNRRQTLLHELQQTMFNEGGYLIPAFFQQLAAYRDGVGGFPARDVRGYGIPGPALNKLYVNS